MRPIPSTPQQAYNRGFSRFKPVMHRSRTTPVPGPARARPGFGEGHAQGYARAMPDAVPWPRGLTELGSRGLLCPLTVYDDRSLVIRRTPSNACGSGFGTMTEPCAHG